MQELVAVTVLAQSEENTTAEFATSVRMGSHFCCGLCLNLVDRKVNRSQYEGSRVFLE